MSDSLRPQIIPLDKYEFPDAPAIDRVQGWYDVIRQKVLQARSEHAVTDDHLSRTELSTLREFVDEPVCRPLLDSLNDKYVGAKRSESFLELLIVPPCDSNAIVADWARHNGHQILKPPARDALCANLSPALPSLEGEGLLVIPQLEHWFMRHRRGLRHVSALLKRIRQCDRPVLVSCNSWCWRYLVHVVDADLILPQPVTFEAFDAQRLRDWIHELSSRDDTDTVRFLDVRDGKDIMHGDDINERFIELANLSLGIPWVAWQLWRRSLRTADERNAGEADEKVDEKAGEKVGEKVGEEDHNDESISGEKTQETSGAMTLWITNNQSPLIPPGHEPEAHRLLHALLIHDSLSVEELADVLPNVGESNITSALIRAGFIELIDDQLRVRAAAYPAVRSGLSGAGISMGAI